MRIFWCLGRPTLIKGGLLVIEDEGGFLLVGEASLDDAGALGVKRAYIVDDDGGVARDHRRSRVFHLHRIHL